MEYLSLTYPRGDTTPLVLYAKGDKTTGRHRLSLFSSQDLTAIPALEIKSENYDGGLPGELVAEYESSKDRTKFTLTPQRDYTENKSLDCYYFSLTQVALDSDEIKETIVTGIFNLLWTGENKYNGIPVTPEEVIPVFASNFEDNELIKVQIVNGVKTYVGTDLFDGCFKLDENGDLMTVDNPITSMYFEVDENGDIQPRL